MMIVIWIVGVALAVVFMANVHVSLRCSRYMFLSCKPPAVPAPKPFNKEVA